MAHDHAGPARRGSLVTTVVLLPDPPVEEIAGERLVAETDLTPADGLAIYRATLADTLSTLEEGTADVLVNYPPADDLPANSDGLNPETELRRIAGTVMTPEAVEAVRFEPQVGSDRSARAGNAITHLVRDEGEQSAAVLFPTPRLVRSIVDEASLKLRRADVVLGPATRGEVYYAGFADLIDFTDVFAERPIGAITRRAREADLDVDFVRTREVLDGKASFEGVLTRIRADAIAEKPVPEHLWETIQERNIRIEDGRITSDAATDSS
jgi:hypothetical protein